MKIRKRKTKTFIRTNKIQNLKLYEQAEYKKKNETTKTVKTNKTLVRKKQKIKKQKWKWK